MYAGGTTEEHTNHGDSVPCAADIGWFRLLLAIMPASDFQVSSEVTCLKQSFLVFLSLSICV